MELQTLHLPGLGTDVQLYAVKELSLADGLLLVEEEFVDRTGLQVWPGAYLLLQFLSLRPHLYKHKHTVELGCGAGLVGLALLPDLASLVLTDGNVDVLQWAAKNALINMPDDEKVTTQLLVWTEGGDNEEAQEEAPLLSSSSSPPTLVLAADVIYDVEVLPPLLATASRLLSQSQKKQKDNEKGRFILSYCGRCLLSDEAFDTRITQVAAKYKLKLESITTTTTTTTITTMAVAGPRRGDATTPALLLAGLEPKVVQTLLESNARVYVFCYSRDEREGEEEDG